MLSSRRILVPIWKSGRFDEENPIAERGFVADLAPVSFFEAPAMAAFLDLDGEACDAALFRLFVVGAMATKATKEQQQMLQEDQAGTTANKKQARFGKQQPAKARTKTNNQQEEERKRLERKSPKK
jgi:mannitol-specific phosphotransferase system IIBC component